MNEKAFNQFKENIKHLDKIENGLNTDYEIKRQYIIVRLSLYCQDYYKDNKNNELAKEIMKEAIEFIKEEM